MVYVIMYLMAIVLANLSVSRFGPAATVVNALLFIGLNLTGRDRLHETWQGRGLTWKMGVLIVTGSLLTVVLNRGAGRIALASTLAFALAAVVDTATYALLGAQAQRVRINGSNVASSLVDSVAFPWLAFGGFLPLVVVGQFAAKVLGGWLWSLVLVRERGER